MPGIKRIKKGDTVKLISGAQKGTTAKVLGVLNGKNAVLLEGIGERHRHVKPTQLNPYGGKKDVHIPVPLHKVALVIDEKSGKTSRVGYIKNADGAKVRLARQANSKEIK
ncbi:50S ribosomal protein L24 [Candidatus Saccharibacteria bacterium]|nr:50S ribosomal protein L24 [Candidatus Saccharibacteria bacterium]NCS82894.1 50S ribosomal protein L24 [Candidatus Saccharibacteria bacterium]